MRTILGIVFAAALASQARASCDSAISAVWGTTTLPTGVSGTAFATSDTDAQKLAKINGWTVAGPHVDVPSGAVVGYLALTGKLSALETFAANPPAGDTDTQAITAAKEFVTMIQVPSLAAFATGTPETYGAVQNFLMALAGDANSGITAADVGNLMALASSQVPWWSAQGCAGPIGTGDLQSAGVP